MGLAALMPVLVVGALAAPRRTPAQPVAQEPVPQVAASPAPATSIPAATATAILEAPIPPEQAAPTSGGVATSTPEAAPEPPRVGVQVGHWKSNELPEELKRLRGSTGAFAAGYSEAQVNLDIAQRVKARLEERGIIVDLIPATVPPAYDADAFVAIHADGSNARGARGFKLATPWRTSRASQHLLETLTAEYGAATGLPQDDAITFNMRGYYAFSWRRHTHATARTTPSVIIEMGFLTSAADRAMMIGQADRVASGIVNGIVRYLDERDSSDSAALLAPDFKVQRPIAASGVDIRASPSDKARVLLHADANSRLVPFQERDGWYQVFVRGSKNRVIGWVRTDQMTVTDDPIPTPPPATDS